MEDKIDSLRPFDEFSDFFNDGYNLAKNDPEFLNDILSSIDEKSGQAKALSWGKWYYENEKDSEKQSLDEIRATRGNAKDKERDFEMEW